MPGHRQRIDRIDRPTGGAQHRDQQPARCLGGIGSASLSPAAASIVVSSAIPSGVSLIRRLAISLPPPSTSAMS